VTAAASAPACLLAGKGYGAEANRGLCQAFGTEPRLHKRGRPHGSASSSGRCSRRRASSRPRAASPANSEGDHEARRGQALLRGVVYDLKRLVTLGCQA
jgi:hypothetical protein